MSLSTDLPELPMHLVMEEILTRLPLKSLMRCMCVSKLWLSLIRSRFFCNRFQKIPMHLVTQEILTRLPPKSLMRFKCVSKLWLSLIRSRYFCNRYPKVPSPRLYMCLCNKTTTDEYQMLTVTPQDNSPTFAVTEVDNRIGGYILQNLGGFMIYVDNQEPHIYNPATVQFISFPIKCFNGFNHIVVPPGREKVIGYYFGYDPLSYKYKAVSLISVFSQETKQVISSDIYIFRQINKLGYWRKAALPPTDFGPHMPSKGGISIDAVIYYLALVDRDGFVLVSFDIRSEEFNMIQVPKLHEDAPDLTLLEYGGKATLCDPTNLRDNGVLALWTVEDVKSKKWSCKSLVLQPSQLTLVDGITFKVKCTTQSGKVLLTPSSFISPFHIFSYDLERNDMRKIEISRIPDHWFNMDQGDDLHISLMFMDKSESLIYSDFRSSAFDWGERL